MGPRMLEDAYENHGDPNYAPPLEDDGWEGTQ